LIHFFLGLLLLWFHLRPNGHPVNLGEAGGVVWFNLNPGGSGTGGEGGLGAPEAVDPKAGIPRTDATPTQPTKPKAPAETDTGPKKVESPPKKPAKLRVTPALPEEAAPPKAPNEKSPAAAGWQGPGQGDEGGNKTGPGGGSGPGLGQGEGGGQGGGKGPGGVGLPGTGGSGNGGEASSILAKIRQKIARAKRYPRQARSEGVEGVCGLSFEISPDGSVASATITKSSGSSLLDEEALATVHRAAPFPYYAGPIRFSLRFSLNDEL